VTTGHDALIEAARAGNEAALSRVISLIERGDVRDADLRHGALHGGAWLIGLTGPPGAGKSVLAAALSTRALRARGPVAVLAVDPSSRFTGGAILGDRIRMGSVAARPGVYVRSFATRGAVGGLAEPVHLAASLLASAGYVTVLVETVGVGQNEIDVWAVADLTVGVVTPGGGDAVQYLKSGVLEAIDIFVVNKADQDGADQTERMLRSTAAPRREADRWHRPIVRTVATTGEGVDQLWCAIEEAMGSRSRGEDPSELARATERLQLRVTARLHREVRDILGAEDARRLVHEVALGRIDLAAAEAEIISLVKRASP